MSQVILLTDCITNRGDPFFGRAIGAYVLANKAKEAGFTAKVIDHISDDSFWEILDKELSESTIFIGISSTFLSSDNFNPEDTDISLKQTNFELLWFVNLVERDKWFNKLENLVNKNAPKAILTIGGTRAIDLMNSDFIRSKVDLFVLGKAENFFVSLLKGIQADEKYPRIKHKDVFYTYESMFTKTEEKIESIDWRDFNIVNNESLPIEIAKGCMYGCKFCNFEKQQSFLQSPERLKESFIKNYEQYGTVLYTFMDDCFNDTRRKVESVCNTILSLPFRIEWVSYARVDVACKFPETLNLMIESGCKGLFWGIETFNYQIAKSIGKGTNPELVKNMLLSLKEKHEDKLISMGSFIIGLPNETEESIENTLNWIVETKALKLVNYLVLSLRPYNEKMDKVIFDYADYSRNPEKYGFKKIQFRPYHDWEHSTMNRSKAYEIRKKWRQELFKNNISNSFFNSIFQYPYIRSLGYSFEEICNLIKLGRWFDKSHMELLERQKLYTNQYFNKFI